MKTEYLLFNFVVIVFPFVLSFARPTYFLHRWRAAMFAIVIAGTPFVLWDALVTGAHWSFNHRYILGIKVLGLPLEEVMFFITVPFACLFSWEHAFRKFEPIERKSTSEQSRLPYLWLVLIPAGTTLFASGRQYTGLMLMALSYVFVVDIGLGTRLFWRPRFYAFLVLTCGFTLVFNTYLTARPVVLYGTGYYMGIRLGTIPVEDFGYGVALIALATIVFEHAIKGSEPVEYPPLRSLFPS